MNVSKTISFLIRSFLFIGVLMNTIYIPIHQSVRFINDDSFELVESLRTKITMAEGDRKKLSKELTDIKLVSSKEIALNEQNQLLVGHFYRIASREISCLQIPL